MFSKGKDVGSKYIKSTLNFNKKNIIPENISNVNKAYTKGMSHNDSHISTRQPKAAHKTKDSRVPNRPSLNKSQQRYKMGYSTTSSQEGSESNTRNYDTRYAKKNSLLMSESRNQNFKKAKSISQEDNKINFDQKVQSQYYNNNEVRSPGVRPALNRSVDKPNLSLNQMMLDEMMKTKKTLNKIPSHKQTLNLNERKGMKRTIDQEKTRKKSSTSLSNSAVYRTKDSRHYSQQQKPMFIANLLNGSMDSKIFNEMQKYRDSEEEKHFSMSKNDTALLANNPMLKSASESNEKCKANFIMNVPHGGALEKLNNEERLNFLSDANLSKIDTYSLNRRAEKSVDLSLRTGALISQNSPDYITNKVISNNMLSKYLTKFIGNRDYRTTEEREYEK